MPIYRAIIEIAPNVEDHTYPSILWANNLEEAWVKARELWTAFDPHSRVRIKEIVELKEAARTYGNAWLKRMSKM